MKDRSKFADLVKEQGWISGCEVGVRKGYFSHLMVSQNPFMEWYAIDCWEINEELHDVTTYETAKQLLEPFGVNIIKDYAENVVDDFDDQSLDFIYIDALHDYESVARDIRLWWPKVKRDGCLAGHDFSPTWPGVIQAVNEFSKKENVVLHITGVGDSYGESDHNQPSWYFFKE